MSRMLSNVRAGSFARPPPPPFVYSSFLEFLLVGCCTSGLTFKFFLRFLLFYFPGAFKFYFKYLPLSLSTEGLVPLSCCKASGALSGSIL